jgi:hypothetical protein
MQKEYKAALSGSAEAATNIQFALFKNLDPRAKQPHPGFYWIKIAAENGLAPDQCLLATVLWQRRSKGISYRLRARYWATKCSENRANRKFGLELLASFYENEKQEGKGIAGNPAEHMEIGDDVSTREY